MNRDELENNLLKKRIESNRLIMSCTLDVVLAAALSTRGAMIDNENAGAESVSAVIERARHIGSRDTD